MLLNTAAAPFVMSSSVKFPPVSSTIFLMYAFAASCLWDILYNVFRILIFISDVALLVKVIARILSKYVAAFPVVLPKYRLRPIANAKYSDTRVNVFPEPADALYTIRFFFALLLVLAIVLYVFYFSGTLYVQYS